MFECLYCFFKIECLFSHFPTAVLLNLRVINKALNCVSKLFKKSLNSLWLSANYSTCQICIVYISQWFTWIPSYSRQFCYCVCVCVCVCVRFFFFFLYFTLLYWCSACSITSNTTCSCFTFNTWVTQYISRLNTILDLVLCVFLVVLVVL